jgi:hypothetical protein
MESANFPRELPLAREQFGFQRTTCGCELCKAPCRHIPGSLDVSDLDCLCPAGRDLFAWAEEHLRALTDKAFPTLVPVRQANGHCHWFFEGRCAVHENAPYSCAFFDAHMSEAEAERRSAATIRARREDAAREGVYYRVWLHLCRKGLTCPSGNRTALAEEVREIRGRLPSKAASGEPPGWSRRG